VVTGYRMHIKGWRSRYCSIYPHAFIGTAWRAPAAVHVHVAARTGCMRVRSG